MFFCATAPVPKNEHSTYATGVKGSFRPSANAPIERTPARNYTGLSIIRFVGLFFWVLVLPNLCFGMWGKADLGIEISYGQGETPLVPWDASDSGLPSAKIRGLFPRKV